MTILGPTTVTSLTIQTALLAKAHERATIDRTPMAEVFRVALRRYLSTSPTEPIIGTVPGLAEEA